MNGIGGSVAQALVVILSEDLHLLRRTHKREGLREQGIFSCRKIDDQLLGILMFLRFVEFIARENVPVVSPLLRIVESDPSAHVIFITGHEVNECARQALAAGAFSLLSKPVEPEQLVTLVRSLVDPTDTASLGRDEPSGITIS